MPPIVVSLINLKGGVAKTTTTVQLAECLVSQHQKKVLVIDLDPQTNATIALITEDEWESRNQDGQTLAQLFKDKLESTSKFDIRKAIVRETSNLELKNLHLLPSSIDLIHIQDRMNDISHKTDHTLNPMEVLKVTLADELPKYDFVLIDCPPNLGFITKNGIEISDYYLIPTIPDRLSTYGMPQIIRSIQEFKTNRKLKIKCLGLVVTKFDSKSTLHQRGRASLPYRFREVFESLDLAPAHYFETVMPLANAFATGVDVEQTPRTFKEKWGRTKSGDRNLYEYVEDLTKEFIEHAK